MGFEADEDIIRHNAAHLLLKVRKEGEKASAISPEEAAKLLGQIDTYYTGQGSYNLLIPLAAVREAGLNTEYWERFDFPKTPRAQGECYNVEYHFAVVGLLPLLEQVAGCSHVTARQTAERYAGSGSGRAKG